MPQTLDQYWSTLFSREPEFVWCSCTQLKRKKDKNYAAKIGLESLVVIRRENNFSRNFC